MKATGKQHRRNGFESMDAVILIILLIGMISILFPFFNMVAVSFTSFKEYLSSKWILWPKEPTISAYQELFKDARILIGFRTTLVYLLVGIPLNIFLSTTLAYGLYRKGWPGRKLILTLVLLTMIFNGGIVPLYLAMRSLHLTNTIWAVILSQGMSAFNMILIYNYFGTIPESLIESANLDGAGEWTILFRIVLPLSKPILATVVLFVSVQLWNEYFSSIIFLRSTDWMSLQQVLRSIVVEAQVFDSTDSVVTMLEDRNFSEGIKMAAVVVTMVPVMCVYPFLQRYFTSGIMIGAIKA